MHYTEWLQNIHLWHSTRGIQFWILWLCPQPLSRNYCPLFHHPQLQLLRILQELLWTFFRLQWKWVGTKVLFKCTIARRKPNPWLRTVNTRIQDAFFLARPNIFQDFHKSGIHPGFGKSSPNGALKSSTRKMRIKYESKYCFWWEFSLIYVTSQRPKVRFARNWADERGKGPKIIRISIQKKVKIKKKRENFKFFQSKIG